jgi:hypothetical protein
MQSINIVTKMTVDAAISNPVASDDAPIPIKIKEGNKITEIKLNLTPLSPKIALKFAAHYKSL